MTGLDVVGIAWEALRAHRVRTRLTAAAVAIGVASVLVLTALGEGARRWIASRFAALGSNVLVVLPGKTETRGGAPPLTANTTRDLTLDDAAAVARRLPGVQRVVPVVIGEALVKHAGRSRRATVVGATRDWLALREGRVGQGTDLPPGDPEDAPRVCVIGATVARELFGVESPLGARLRVGEASYRVVGVIAPSGYSMMANLDDLVLVPVATALRLFDRTGLFRLVVQLEAAADLASAEARLGALLRERHDGDEDFTVLTPGAIAASLGRVVGIVTGALVAIAAVSLVVAGVLVTNVMVVSVTERTAEIGLMKALGASDRQVLAVFLAEAVLLTLAGAVAGAAAGLLLARLGRALYPEIPFEVPAWALGAALLVAGAVGLAFGSLPAARAARLVPLEALRKRLG